MCEHVKNYVSKAKTSTIMALLGGITLKCIARKASPAIPLFSYGTVFAGRPSLLLCDMFSSNFWLCRKVQKIFNSSAQEVELQRSSVSLLAEAANQIK